MPTRNYTSPVNRGKRLRVTTCEGSVSVAVQTEHKPTLFSIAGILTMTNAEAVTLRDLLNKALADDPFTPTSASQ